MNIIVCGGGIVGVTTLHSLIGDGHEVTLIDRQSDVAMECSHANGGYVAISQAVPWSSPGAPTKTLKSMAQADAPILLHLSQIPAIWRWGLEFMRCSRPGPSWENTRHILRLALYSFDALKVAREETGVRYDAVAKGCLKVFSDQMALDDAIATSDAQIPFGLTYRPLGPRECLELAPALAPRIESLCGGIHYANEECGDCFAFARGIAAWCRERGALFALSTKVAAFEREGDRIVAALTDRGRMTADAFVLALGADSPRLTAPLGVRLPIIPVKGYSLTVPRALWPEAPDLPVLDEMRKFGYAPLGKDRLRMTGFAEIAGYDTVPRARRMRAFARAFTGLFPQLEDRLSRIDLKPFCCLRPVTPDGLPIIGRSRFRNLYYNVGHGHLGWTLAHGSARIVAAAIAGRDPDIDATSYAPRRAAMPNRSSGRRDGPSGRTKG